MRRPLAILLLAVVAVVLAVSIASTLRHTPVRAVTLPDGVRLEFLGTSVGRANFSTELPWHRWLRKVLPRKWLGWIPSALSANCSSGTNSVTAYLRLVDSVGQTLGARPWQGYAAEDDTGFPYPRQGGGCSTGGDSGDRLHGVILEAYPRRQSSFWLRFFDQTNGVMASLRVPNPVRGPFPVWQSAALPQTLTNGPMILTLEALRESGREPWVYVSPQWDLRATDPSWREARVRSFIFLDATGNEGSSLSRREPAWKGRALVYRERFEDFAPVEKLVVTNVTIPAVGEYVEVDESAELAGVSVSVLVLAGAGEFMITNGISRSMMPSTKLGSGHSTMSFGNTMVESWQGDKPFLLVQVQKALPNDELFIHLYDEKGQAVKMEREGGWAGGRSSARFYRRDLDLPADAESVNLEIVVSRPLEFEFMVNPADVQPAKP